MTAFRRRDFFAGVLVLGLVSSLVMPVGAASADDPASQIEAFYAALVETMKQGPELGIEGRYKKLAPAIEAAFDLPAMTTIAVGPSWNSIAPDKQTALINAFKHMTVATYARNFSGYSGQRFEVDPAVETRSARRIVRTALVQEGKEPIPLAYLMHQNSAVWKIIDVYYSGNVSQIAARRSEFSATLKAGGVDSLLQKLSQLGDRLMKNT